MFYSIYIWFRKWNQSLLEEALSSLQEELALPDGVPGGMEVYRQSLVLSFFFKFYLKVIIELGKDPKVSACLFIHIGILLNYLLL